MEAGWIYTIFPVIILIAALIIASIKKNRSKKENKKPQNFGEIIKNKLEIVSLLIFVMAMFLLDVNANMLAAYGINTQVTFFGNMIFPATSMFWLGFLVGLISFLSFTTISIMQRKNALKKLDLFFSVIGGIGLGIILSGGLLVFGGLDDLIIPFFKWSLDRTTYYHIGIAIEALTVFYFALARK